MSNEIRIVDGWPGSEIAFMACGTAAGRRFVVGVSSTAAATRDRYDLEDFVRSRAAAIEAAQRDPDLWERFGLKPDPNHDGIMSRHFSSFDFMG